MGDLWAFVTFTTACSSSKIYFQTFAQDFFAVCISGGLFLPVGLTDILATRTVVIGTVAVEPADVTDVAIGSFLTAFRIMIR